MSKKFKNKTRVIPAILMALLILISFAGCGSNNSKAKEKSFKYEIVKTEKYSVGDAKNYDLYVVIKQPLSKEKTTRLFKQIVEEFTKEKKVGRLKIYLYDDERDIDDVYNLGFCDYNTPTKEDLAEDENAGYNITYVSKKNDTKPTEDEMKFYYAVNKLKDKGVEEPKAIKQLAKKYGYTKDEATLVYGNVYGYKTPY